MERSPDLSAQTVVDIDDERGDSSRLSSLLEFEISRLQSQASQPGWTAWALLGALATVLWFLASELDSSALVPLHVTYVFVVLSLMLDAARDLQGWLAWTPESGTQRLRFRIAESAIAPARLGLVIMAVRAAVLWALLSALCGPALLPWIACLVRVYFSLHVLGAAAGLVLSFTRIPVLDDVSQLSGRWRTVVGLAWHLLLHSAFLLVLWPLLLGVIDPSLVAWKVGGLLFVASGIIMVGTHPVRRSPLLDSLSALRRELGFGHPARDIATRARMALDGLSVPDVLQRELGDILNELSQLAAVLAQADERIQRIKEIHGASFRELEGDEKKEAERLSDEVLERMKEADAIVNRALDAQVAFNRRALFITSVHPEGAKEIDKLLERVDEAALPLREQSDDMRQIVQDLMTETSEE